MFYSSEHVKRLKILQEMSKKYYEIFCQCFDINNLPDQYILCFHLGITDENMAHFLNFCKCMTYFHNFFHLL